MKSWRCPIARPISLDDATPFPGPLRISTLVLVAVSYFACIAIATFPAILSVSSAIPGFLGDPLEHLWIMRWYERSLIQNHSPFFCDGLNAPSGVPLGLFPTMHLQTLGYLVLSELGANDYVCFNAIWFFAFVSTGLGSFTLAWWTVRGFWPAWLAGLGTMLSGPMFMHAHGHLETMQLGFLPLFLIGWIRFVDHPSSVRMSLAAILYLAQVAAAPYYAVLAVFPASWYVFWSMSSPSRQVRLAFLRGRLAWLLAYTLVVLPGLVLIFSPQIWASSHGFEMVRTRWEFNQYRAPIWSTFVPSPMHNFNPYLRTVFPGAGSMENVIEGSSYLGVVTLGLLAYALFGRVRFPKSSFWWSGLALMIVLSWGAHTSLGATRLDLPSGWLYRIFPPFRLIRCPTRFNLFAAVFASVPAAAAVDHLLKAWKHPIKRFAFVVAATGIMFADLAMIPFPVAAIPPMPPVYGELVAQNLATRIVDSPIMGSDTGQFYSALWGYWQSIHNAKTTAGYPGLVNLPFVTEIVPTAPFWEKRLADPHFLKDPGSEQFGLVRASDAHDYGWLFLKAHKFDYIFLHRGEGCDPRYETGTNRLALLFREARIRVSCALFRNTYPKPSEPSRTPAWTRTRSPSCVPG